jgi:site-specific DNA recombinase
MKTAIYARVSTERQEKQETINSQLAALRSYADNNGHIIFKEYVDEGYSGELLDRPALDELRDDAKQKLIDVVLVHSPDRLSRKFIFSGLVQEELTKSGVRIIFLNRPDSKDTPEDNLLNGVQGLIAEFEKAKILERTRRGRMHKAKSNLLVGNIPPYGYRYIAGDKSKNSVGHYVINIAEAKAVKLIFSLFVDKHLSIRAIARELTQRNIPPRQGKHWRTSSLHSIIRNETYVGVTHYNKHVSVEAKKHRNGIKYQRATKTSMHLRSKDQWVPIVLPSELIIIDKGIFVLAQNQLIKNSELSPRNVKYQYLLRGLIQCGNCGSPFYGTLCHGKFFYRCGNRHRTFPLPRECKVKMAKAGELETAVWEKFCEAIKNPRLITEQITKLREREQKKEGSVLQDIELVEKELKNTEDEESRLLDAYREKIISMEQLKEQMTKIREKKKRWGQEKQVLLSKQEKSLTALDIKKTVKDYCGQIEQRLESLEDDFEGKRYLLSLALNQVVLEGNLLRIKGILPVYPVETFTSGDIASTSSGGCDCPRKPLR